MNITSNEIMLLDRKNMALGMKKSNASAHHSMPGRSYNMSALDMQAGSNIAFHANTTQIVKALGIGAAALAGAALSTTSCTKYIQEETTPPDPVVVNVSQSQYNTQTIDFGNLAEILGKIFDERFFDLLEKIEQNTGKTADNTENIKNSLNEFAPKIDSIINLLKLNNAYNDDIKNSIDSIKKYMTSGEWEKAYAAMMEVLKAMSTTLEKINDGVNSLNNKVDSLRTVININHEDLKNTIITSANGISTTLGEKIDKTNEALTESNGYSKEIRDLVTAGNISRDQGFAMINAHLLNNDIMNGLIYHQLVSNGMTEKQAADTLNEIRGDLAKYNGKWEERDDARSELLENNFNLLNNAISGLTEEVAKINNFLDVKFPEMYDSLKALIGSKADEIKGQLAQLYSEVVSGNISAKQFYQYAVGYMMSDTAIKNAMLQQLYKMGYNQEQANKKLDQLNNQVGQGIDKAEAAFEELMNILNSIDSKLDVIIAQGNSLIDLVNKLYNQGEIAEAQRNQIVNKINSLINEVKSGNKDAKGFYQAAVSYMVTDSVMSQLIYDQLIKNGYSQQQANKYLQDLNNKASQGLEAGQAAFEEIMNVLNSIDGKLDVIIAQGDSLIKLANKLYEQGKLTYSQFTALNNKITSLINEVKAGNKDAKGFYQAAVSYMIQDSAMSQLIYAQLKKNGKTETEIAIYLQQLNVKADESAEAGAAAFEELMSVLNSINSKIDVLIEQGDTIISLISQFKELGTAKINELINYVKALQKDVQNGNKTDKEFYQQATMYMLNDAQLQNLILYNTIKNGKSIQEGNQLIKNLKIEVQSGDLGKIEAAFEDVINLLKSIDATTKAAYELLNSLAADVKGLRQDVSNGFIKVSGDIGDLTEYVKKIKNNQELYMPMVIDKINTSNTRLTSIDNKLTNLEDKTDTIILELQNHVDSGNGGMTKKEFEEALAARDTKYLASWQAMLDALHIDQILVRLGISNANEATIIDLMNAIKTGIGDLTALKQEVHNVYTILLEKLPTLDQTSEDYEVILNKIAKLLEDLELKVEVTCNCNCNNGGSSNNGEYIDDQLGDLFN